MTSVGMTPRLRMASAAACLVALLAEVRAFAAGGTAAAVNLNQLHSIQMPQLRADVFHGDRLHVNPRTRDETLPRTKPRGHASARRALTRLRGGALDDAIPPPDPPTNLRLLRFYFPCLALWISGPLLSLVDTSFVGLSAGSGTAAAAGGSGSAAQLAALGPATTFVDGGLYLFAFLNVATTNLYASARARGTSEKRNRAGVDELPGEGVVRTAARTSLFAGLGLMALLLAVARPLIALYIGESRCLELRTRVGRWWDVAFANGRHRVRKTWAHLFTLYELSIHHSNAYTMVIALILIDILKHGHWRRLEDAMPALDLLREIDHGSGISTVRVW